MTWTFLWTCLVQDLLATIYALVARTSLTRAVAARNHPVIDHECFPHIMDAIIAHAPPKSLVVLASTSRAFRKRLGFATHVNVIASCFYDELVTFYFDLPGKDIRGVPHVSSRFKGNCSPVQDGPISTTDPLVAEAFKRFRFVDMTLYDKGECDTDVYLPRYIEPEYIRMPGLRATTRISRMAAYTVLLGSQGQNLSAYPRGMLPPCPCHTTSLTVVLEPEPCDPYWCPLDDPRTHWHYVLHYVGPDARESSRLSPSPPVDSREHPKVAIGTLSRVDDLYVGESEDYKWGEWLHPKPDDDRAWMERLWKNTTYFEQQSLEEFASANYMSQADINFERGVPYDIFETGARRRVVEDVSC